MPKDYFEIRIRGWNDDMDMFKEVVNQGIDARLEGFTRSNFQERNDGMWHLDFHKDELQILIRRLLELDDEHAERWADDIVYAEYGVEGV